MFWIQKTLKLLVVFSAWQCFGSNMNSTNASYGYGNEKMNDVSFISSEMCASDPRKLVLTEGLTTPIA